MLACPGASLGGNPTEALTAGVLQHVLGGCSYVKWGGTASRLGKAVSAALEGPFAVSHGWGGCSRLEAGASCVLEGGGRGSASNVWSLVWCVLTLSAGERLQHRLL